MFASMAKTTKLDKFLEDNPEVAKGFAGRIKVTRQALSRYRAGERIPEREPMQAIYVETDGEVDPNSFYDLPALRPAPKRREAAAAR